NPTFAVKFDESQSGRAREALHLLATGRPGPQCKENAMKLSRLIVPALMLALAGAAQAAEVEIKMLNKGAEGPMVFEPSFVKVEPGDVVRFVPTDKSHDVASISGMLPEGVDAFEVEMNKEYALTV